MTSIRLCDASSAQTPPFHLQKLTAAPLAPVIQDKTVAASQKSHRFNRQNIFVCSTSFRTRPEPLKANELKLNYVFIKIQFSGRHHSRFMNFSSREFFGPQLEQLGQNSQKNYFYCLFMVRGVDWTRHSSLSIHRLFGTQKRQEQTCKHVYRNHRITPSRKSCQLQRQVVSVWWLRCRCLLTDKHSGRRTQTASCCCSPSRRMLRVIKSTSTKSRFCLALICFGLGFHASLRPFPSPPIKRSSRKIKNNFAWFLMRK